MTKHSTTHVFVIGGVGAAGATTADALVRSLPTNNAIIVLLDYDPVVQAHNIRKTAPLRAGDVGRGPKATRVARHLRQIRPDLSVVSATTSVRAAGLGVFRLASADNVTGLEAFDNLHATLTFTGLAAKAGVGRMYSLKLEGGDSPSASLGLYAPGQGGPCPACSWGEREWKVLAAQCHPCTRADETPHPGGFVGPLHLAAEAVYDIERNLAGSPTLQPGEQLVILPEQRQYLTLHRPTSEECPVAPHRAVQTQLQLPGRVPDCTVQQFVQHLDLQCGGNWSWSFGCEASFFRCLDCGSVVGLQRLGIDMPPLQCPRCSSPQLERQSPVTCVTAADLLPASSLVLAELWPPGDIISIAANGRCLKLGLPVDGLTDWFFSQEAKDGKS